MISTTNMTGIITLKTKDICGALSVGRHQLRAWTNDLLPYRLQQTKERSARRFQPADLLFFAVIKHLTEEFGLSLSFIERFSAELYECIREPHSLIAENFLFISNSGYKCEKLDKDNVVGEGIVVDIHLAQDVVCRFLGLSTRQTQLQLGLVKVN